MRRRELDFLRGVALIVMTVGHPIRTDILRPQVDFFRFHYNIYGELFSAFFMFMSAINVNNFIESAKKTPNLDATKFYIRSSIALFFMGSTYNICIGTLPVIDIIQAVAIGSLFTYMLLRHEVSSVSLFLITAAFFAAGIIIVGPNPLNDAVFVRLGPLKYLMALFGPIPWLGFFTYGILIDRIPRGRWEIAAVPFFLLVFIGSHFLPRVEGTGPAVILFKANARYIALACGLIPAMHLAGRRWYRGGRRIYDVIESWGVESLVFLIFHWSVIMVLLPFMMLWRTRFGETMAVWSVSGITLLVMWRLVPVVVSRRESWMKSPRWVLRLWRAFFGGLVGWAAFMLIAAAGASAHRPLIAATTRFLSVVSAFCAGYAFCFLYPHFRMHLRRVSMIKNDQSGAV